MTKIILYTLLLLTFSPPSLAFTSSVSDSSDYVLNGGDRISISVLEFPEYSGERTIPEGGVLQLPLLGNVNVAGLTQKQTAELLRNKYKMYLKRPQVSVSVITPRSIAVVVSGEVNRPGTYTPVGAVTLSSVLTQAEGVTLAADLHNVQLRRRGSIKTVDLTTLIAGGQNDIKLLDGDVVYLQPTQSINTAEIKQTSGAAFAASVASPRTVTVVGEVNRPGSYTITGDELGRTLPTLTKAIQTAGGITSVANVQKVELRRLTSLGTRQTITLNLWDLLQKGDTNQDAILQNGDTIIVPVGTMTAEESTALATSNFSPATVAVSVVGEVKTPGTINLPPNTPLNQAILTAGGFNDDRAKRNSVELVRLNPDGSVSKSKIKVNMASGIGANNPTLKANDIIVVGRSKGARVGDALGTVFNPVRAVLGILGL